MVCLERTSRRHISLPGSQFSRLTNYSPSGCHCMLGAGGEGGGVGSWEACFIVMLPRVRGVYKHVITLYGLIVDTAGAAHFPP